MNKIKELLNDWEIKIKAYLKLLLSSTVVAFTEVVFFLGSLAIAIYLFILIGSEMKKIHEYPIVILFIIVYTLSAVAHFRRKK